ncbi:SPFH domain-containing protein [Nocardioides campestrisoli]|uniref:SPFH domain-containing protein n=1 Tax=Nocardioides campestrisoli TaxID=2736757 RepID=UPI0015E73310|nr:SPFH domain-containing protein [Nocardioides campestrisoli]
MAKDLSGRSTGGRLFARTGAAVGLLVVALLVVLVFARPTTVSTGPDQVALHYTGGAFTPTRFGDCVGTSSRAWDGPGDKHFSYPSSQRNYVFGENGDRGGMTFVTKDGIEMAVDGVASFMLNTECQTLRRFHDLIGNRYSAYMDSSDGNGSQGWLNMLAVYVSKPLETAVDRASQNYTYTDLYMDPNVKAQWERDVLDQLPDLVGRQIDGEEEFFTNFSITLQKPVPPESVKAALTAQQEAVAKAKAKEAEADAQVKAAEAQVKVEKAEAQKIQERINVLGRDGYLRQYAIDKGLNPYQPTTSGIIQNRE